MRTRLQTEHQCKETKHTNKNTMSLTIDEYGLIHVIYKSSRLTIPRRKVGCIFSLFVRFVSVEVIVFPFPQYFQYISNLGVKFKIHSVKGGCWIICFSQFRKSDMSKYGYRSVS